MELSGRKKLHALSLAEKIQVLELLDESKMSQSEVARRFQVSQPQISRICKNKEKLLADWRSGTANRQRKRKRASKYSGLDEALRRWYHVARARAWDVTGPVLLHKAKELADVLGQDFVPSIGWLVRWKRRNNVGPGAPRHVLLPPGSLLSIPARPPAALRDFAPEDVFGCAEVPLLYRAEPGGRVGAGEWVRVLLCASSRGTEKRPALVTGPRASPACFFGVSSEALPASYYPGPATPWAEWLVRFDRDVGRQGRRVALLLATREAGELAGLPGLGHVRLLPVPPAAPSLPGLVVQAFKTHYRRRLLGKLAATRSARDGASTAPAGTAVTLLDALHLTAAAWAKVPSRLIARGFAQGGPAPGKMDPEQDPPAPPGLSREEFSHFVDLEGEEPELGVCKEEVGGPGEEDGGAQDGFQPLPTRADALQALGTLRRWMECSGSSPELLEKFYECEEEVERLCCP
ncbi:tigger transposable element-derived protein 3 isoform X2 [Erinaceus europaeus]|nr:tigger transposable element-derived protein 3 isoform X2 [Erinaceus europaeus]